VRDTHDPHRRKFLRMAATASAVATLATFPPPIRRALALPASTKTGTIMDVQHIVILMLENRSFDHYFGTLRGVRGFGDRHLVPLASGRPVWYQSDGEKEIPPFHLNAQTRSALRFPGTPHRFGDAQAAWAQGRFGQWPRFKTPMSMGYFKRNDLPFQFALAEAFTICDAHHCSVTTGTDPNRIMFWSGSNFDPVRRRRGANCTEADAEVNNLRCGVEGTMPTPGYTYHGSAFEWQTLPEILEGAGISWRIYQDPNDNWTGLMHGGLAFASFRKSQPGSPIYKNGMSHWSLEQFAQDVRNDTLPRVSWVLPSMLQSEHPSPSSPPQGAEFTSRILQALTANPAVWSRTVFFLTFDENDGLFDHVPPPAPPSFNPDGTPAGRSTLDLSGQYFSDRERKNLHSDDNVSGTVRPWGLGPRVPLYVISPWSRGGWVNSQVFDHTSVGQFLESRFGITVPAISPWNRAVCGDLTSAFDFVTPNETSFPELPWVAESAARIAANLKHPPPTPPVAPEDLYQEPGMRRSRALPYELHVHARTQAQKKELELTFENSGTVGAVFHVYDRLHLERIPRRYTIEAGKTLTDEWVTHPDQGRYDLWVYGPNGFVREFRGSLRTRLSAVPEIRLRYNTTDLALEVIATNSGTEKAILVFQANAYRSDGPWSMHVPAGRRISREWSVAASHRWYDFSIRGEDMELRLAGRIENGRPGFSDPAI
jgi:phospholipase C